MPRIVKIILIIIAALLLLYWLTGSVSAQLTTPETGEFIFDTPKPIGGAGTSSGGSISVGPQTIGTPSEPGILSGTLSSLQKLTSEGFITSQLMAWTVKGLSLAVYWISYFIGFIASIIFFLGGTLIQLGLKLNTNIISDPIVTTGWLITRDFANLGFVLGIIAIAFATMLRLESYGMRRLLTSLIIMAVLVNFSLSIVGVLIDATGIISNFFITKATPGGTGDFSQFAENLAGAFQVQKLHEVKDITQLPQIKGAADLSVASMGLIASVFFVALFTIFGAAVMMAIAGMVLVRYIYMAILIILMPIAWVFSIFPHFKGYGSKWWDSFLSWLIFLPTALFFLYLSVLMVTNRQEMPNAFQHITTALQAETADSWDKFLLVIKDTFAVFAQMIVILGVMLGGLIAAKSASGFGSKFILGAADGIIGWGTGKAKGTALAPGRFAGQRVVGSETAQKLADRMAKTPGLRRLGSGLSNIIAQEKKEAGKKVGERVESRLQNLSDDGLKAAPETTMINRAAKTSELAKRGLLGEYLDTVGSKEKYIEAAKQTGKDREILNAVPHLAEEFGKKVEEVVSRISPKDVMNISKESLKKIEVIAALKGNQLKSLGKNAAPEIKKIIEETLGKEIRRLVAIPPTDPKNIRLLADLRKVEKIVNTPAWQ